MFPTYFTGGGATAEVPTASLNGQNRIGDLTGVNFGTVTGTAPVTTPIMSAPIGFVQNGMFTGAAINPLYATQQGVTLPGMIPQTPVFSQIPTNIWAGQPMTGMTPYVLPTGLIQPNGYFGVNGISAVINPITGAVQQYVPTGLIPQTFIPQAFVPQTVIPQGFVPQTTIPQNVIPQTFVPQTGTVNTTTGYNTCALPYVQNTLGTVPTVYGNSCGVNTPVSTLNPLTTGVNPFTYGAVQTPWVGNVNPFVVPNFINNSLFGNIRGINPATLAGTGIYGGLQNTTSLFNPVSTVCGYPTTLPVNTTSSMFMNTLTHPFTTIGNTAGLNPYVAAGAWTNLNPLNFGAYNTFGFNSVYPFGAGLTSQFINPQTGWNNPLVAATQCPTTTGLNWVNPWMTGGACGCI